MTEAEYMALHELRIRGPLPEDLEAAYLEYRATALLTSGTGATTAAPPVSGTVVPGLSVSDWLRVRWATADAAARHSLRTLADTLAIPLPLMRTRQARATDSTEYAMDSSSARRTDPDLGPNVAETDPAGEDPILPPGWEDRPPEWPEWSEAERGEFEEMVQNEARLGRSRKIRAKRAREIIKARREEKRIAALPWWERPVEPAWHEDDAPGWSGDYDSIVDALHPEDEERGWY